MKLSRWATPSLLIAFTLAGCNFKSEEPAPPPPAPAPRPVAEIRARFARLNPDVVTGIVIASRPADRLVSVGDLKVSDFRIGDVVTFHGADDKPLGSGEVVEISKDALHVRYPIPAAGERVPANGDIAIHFKR